MAIADQSSASSALFARADSLRIEASHSLGSAGRAEMGQFFTPAPLAAFMASLAKPCGGEDVRLLDAGAGSGSLTFAWVARACESDPRPRSIHVTLYEVDPRLTAYLQETVGDCQEMCEAAGVRFSADILAEDFISAGATVLADTPLFPSSQSRYTRAILNPPYRKISSQSAFRRQLREVGIETSNLYTAFLWLAFRLLEPNGELIAITPRSFCNGPYFSPFRRALFGQMRVRRLHVFESRNVAFKDDDVLQENMILCADKSTVPTDSIVSSSKGPGDSEIVQRSVRDGELVRADDPNLVIHIAPDELTSRFADSLLKLPASLNELGINVSTGRVVDFRSREHLAFDAGENDAPLIYPGHFQDGRIAWPRGGKKPDYLRINGLTCELLVPAGTYVLVKRFSAKEEPRRISAAICDSQSLPQAEFAFENHLNYFHQAGQGLPANMATGLAAYLNSTLADTYFRQISGHTQVNASDLRSLRYPSLPTLERIGDVLGNRAVSQDDLDLLIGDELNMAEKDPPAVANRIGEARAVLTALGLPAKQQNERSALTLLTLLELKPGAPWTSCHNPLLGITPIMDWFAENYGRRYAPNTRETVRRQTVHQLLEAGLLVANPDDPSRSKNSGQTVYQIRAEVLEVLRSYGQPAWNRRLKKWLKSAGTLVDRYAKQRAMTTIPLQLPGGKRLRLSAGKHNVLMKLILREFCPRFTPGATPLYVGDTAKKWAHFDEKGLSALGVSLDPHGKMPDLVIHHSQKNWLILIEAVTSHGPVDAKRRDELKRLFASSTAGLVYVTAFLNRAALVRYLADISWETEVWVADAPSHLIHFDGERFLGPYNS